MAAIETLLFDFGGTLDADGVAWKDRFYGLCRAEELDMTADMFARAYYAADDPLVGALPITAGLPQTVDALASNLEAELGWGGSDRGRSVASRFLSDMSTIIDRNRPVLEALRERYQLGVVSNFYGNLEAVCESSGLAPLFGVMTDSRQVGVEKPDPAIFRAALGALARSARDNSLCRRFAAPRLRGRAARGHGLHLDRARGRPGRGRTHERAPVHPRRHHRTARSDQGPEMTGALKDLRGGIIAAGHGTRLRADGYVASKPMTTVAGRPLIEHALDRFRAVGIRRATVIINEASDDCRRWLGDHSQDFDLDLIVRTTPSSYASFRLVAARLADSPALITTVDSILPVDDFRRFVRLAAGFPYDAVVLGLTSHVDDDNPLWATLDAADGRILRLGGDNGSHVTAGLYWLPAHELAEPSAGFGRLRDYLKWLVDQGRPVYGVVLPQVFDIDRAHDVEAAELAGFHHEHENAGE